MNKTEMNDETGTLNEHKATFHQSAPTENNADEAEEEAFPIYTQIDLVMDWLDRTIVEDGDLATRGLASAAYDSLGALLALTWDRESLMERMEQAKAVADGAVDLPAIKTVIGSPRL